RMESAMKAYPALAAAPPTAAETPQIAGFSFVSYSPQTAVIDIVVRYQSGAMGVAPFTVEWLDGDWELSPTPGGEVSGPAQQVSSTVGYIAWSGV
ncbi:MAG: hypothetical protein ACP5VR_12910, partial [Acidimicrobiales bacterium]